MSRGAQWSRRQKHPSRFLLQCFPFQMYNIKITKTRLLDYVIVFSPNWHKELFWFDSKTGGVSWSKVLAMSYWYWFIWFVYIFGLVHLEKSRDSKIRRLFDSREEKLFSLFLMKRLGKLISFWGQMVLRMKLIAKKDLILLFQMTPSRILCDR